MHDICDLSLKEEATKKGITIIDVLRVTKATHSSKFTMAASSDRSFLKSTKMLYNLEILDKRRDHLHHRNSGLDSTLAKLCSANKVLIGINLANLRTLDPVVIGRVMQNIEICRTHKTKMAVFSDAKSAAELPNSADVQSLLLVLGMSTRQARETLSALEGFSHS